LNVERSLSISLPAFTQARPVRNSWKIAVVFCRSSLGALWVSGVRPNHCSLSFGVKVVVLHDCTEARGCRRLPVSVVGPLLDGLNTGVDDGGLLNGVGTWEVGPGGEHVGAGGDVADDLGAGDDVADGETVGAEGSARDGDVAGQVGAGNWDSSWDGSWGSPLGGGGGDKGGEDGDLHVDFFG